MRRRAFRLLTLATLRQCLLSGRERDLIGRDAEVALLRVQHQPGAVLTASTAEPSATKAGTPIAAARIAT